MDNKTNITLDKLLQNATKSNLPSLQPVIVVDFWQWFRYGYEVILFGYFMPTWTVVNLLIYTYMIYVFIKTGMTSKTHICLISIAVFDSISPICPSIMWLYVFALKKHMYYLPLEWCRAYHYMTEVIPQIITTITYSLTLMMAIIRYIVVAHPFKANDLCSKRRITVGIISCVVISIIGRGVPFFHYNYSGITIPAFNKPNETMQACVIRKPNWIRMDFFEYLAIFQAVSLFCFVIIPNLVMLVTEILLVVSMVKNSKKRTYLTSNVTQRKERDTRLTQATVVIVGLHLINGLSSYGFNKLISRRETESAMLQNDKLQRHPSIKYFTENGNLGNTNSKNTKPS
ncbi:Hypothetical predicted protein [Mytilus galloprovincialis]|uniref:G-protein coupled receptors family 1 profile domain-containing protein n=1 Tax=Mytilus galloprovincialis TaxID=29158 RepID=A0A8B6FPY0_MYTGA|nr:Hypothetical predicted protein [Mytilus galloprovincialis]